MTWKFKDLVEWNFIVDDISVLGDRNELSFFLMIYRFYLHEIVPEKYYEEDRRLERKGLKKWVHGE